MPRQAWLATLAAYLAALAAAVALAARASPPAAVPVLAPVASGTGAAAPAPPAWAYLRVGSPGVGQPPGGRLLRTAAAAASALAAGYSLTPQGMLDAVFPGLASLATAGPAPGGGA